jgi:hypothetical protein
MRCGGEGIVSFEFNHGPDSHAHRCQRFFEWLKLREQRALDSGAGFITGPELIAKRLDDVIGGDADVSCAVLQHAKDGSEHSGDGAKRWISFLETPDAVEVPEEFVSAVDKVNDHFRNPHTFRVTKWIVLLLPKNRSTNHTK